MIAVFATALLFYHFLPLLSRGFLHFFHFCLFFHFEQIHISVFVHLAQLCLSNQIFHYDSPFILTHQTQKAPFWVPLTLLSTPLEESILDVRRDSEPFSRLTARSRIPSHPIDSPNTKGTLWVPFVFGGPTGTRTPDRPVMSR